MMQTADHLPDSLPDPAIILDAHLDIAYNTRRNGRDFTRSVYKQRVREAGTFAEKEGVITVALPEALLGRVGVVFGTIFVSPATSAEFGDEKISYNTPREAYQRAIEQWEVYQDLADRGVITLINTQSDLAGVLDSWREGIRFEDHRLGVVLSMEGADPILEPAQFEEWYARGIRAVGLAWGGTRYSGGAVGSIHDSSGLSGIGRELLDVMGGLNAILDISHMSTAAADESIDRYSGAIIASHSNSRHFVDEPRQLHDSTIRRLAERDGVVGIPMYNRFLKAGWKSGPNRKREVTLADQVIAAIDHICQITGSSSHVGIGTDLDGGLGQQHIPAEVDNISDIWQLGALLHTRGYDQADVMKILSGNFLRVLRHALPT